MSDTKPRPLSQIARDIGNDWGAKMSPYARPYWLAMLELQTINDKYHWDNAHDVVLRFLCNANAWRGPIARAVKLELKQIANIK
ncbi:hypothetical protein UFOVP70_17 [uncultured Caudovirales phage]|uniref:Uncharacterized protein n=1 Tax=uncultured Caudovirales phage TaxID=2100421 RepID=A0A6J5KZC7_9CAUD|nr:hypothetical protein UFOVP70_17 [uncultured Caudovirales phage]